MFGPPCYSDPVDSRLDDYPDYLGNLDDMDLSIELENAKEYCASPKATYLILKEMRTRVAAEIEKQNREYEEEVRRESMGQ